MSKVPKLRFPEFEVEWEEKELGDITKYENGKDHENDISEEGKYIVVNSKFISTEGLVKKYSDKAHCLAKKNDILMVLSDVPNGKAISKCFIVKENNCYTVNQRICVLSPKEGIIANYLFYILDRNPYFLAFDDGVKQTNLKKEEVLNFNLSIPADQKEQQKIADCLSSLDELIEARKEKIASLKTYKKGLLQQLFPQDMCNNYPPHPLIFSKLPKLRFAGFEGEWEEVKLGEIGVFLSSLTGKIKEDFEQGNAKYIPYKNVYKNTFVDIRSLEKVNVREEEKQNAVKKGDILFTISSETPEEAGMSSVLVDEIKDCYVNSFCSLFRFNSLSDKNIYFYGYLLRHHTIREYFRKTAQGSTRFNLSKESFKNLSLVVPKLGEQQKIADCLLSLDEKIAAETEQVAQLQQHKKGLLQQLLV